MIGKFRTRFIALSMTAIAVLLAVVIAGMNLINYRAVVAEADQTLQLLSSSKGRFPDMNPGKQEKTEFGERREEPQVRDFSPELPYESRYFSVLLSAAGNVIVVDRSRIVSVDEDAAIAYAKTVFSGSRDRGFLDRFRYIRSEDGGAIRVIFLDCERKLASFRTFLYASLVMALVGIVAVFFVICVCSGRMIRPIAESYEKQKRFITDAGHEIKTPLTIIQANADILEMELGENESVADIRQQTGRLRELTEDLVLLSRMEESVDSMQRIDFPLSEVVAESAKPFRNLALQQNKTLTCAVQPMLTVRGNDRAIQKLVSILLENALKYSPGGTEITLTLEKQGKTTSLTVRNVSLTELSQENLAHLFDRFYRTDASRNSETGGYGIGLSVAQSIVAAHGGKIQASMHGGVFSITAALPNP